MNKLTGAFLAMGVVAVACGNDGNGNDGKTPAAAGAAGEGTGATEADGGSSPVSTAGAAGSSAQPDGGGSTGGTKPTPVEGGNANGGEQQSVSLGGAFEEVHGDPPIDPECGDYSELHDRGNGSSYSPGEQTKLAFDTPITICGRIDAYHFEPDAQSGIGTVDADWYRLNVLTDATYQISLEIVGNDVPPDMVVISANPGYGGQDTGVLYGSHAVAWPQLYDNGDSIGVEAYGKEPLDHSIYYKIHIKKDDPSARCTTVKAADAKQSYTEAHDGADSKGNDVVHYKFQQAQTPTPQNDAPEPSGIVLNTGDHSLIQGNAAFVDYGEDYDDTDMYAIKTGTSDVLTFRLDWLGNKTDLDLLLFDANDMTFQYLDYAVNFDLYGPEVLVTGVKPNTNYWLYVGSGSDSLAGGLPSTYTVTMCGEKFKF
jgi:hypothetical protein